MRRSIQTFIVTQYTYWLLAFLSVWYLLTQVLCPALSIPSKRLRTTSTHPHSHSFQPPSFVKHPIVFYQYQLLDTETGWLLLSLISYLNFSCPLTPAIVYKRNTLTELIRRRVLQMRSWFWKLIVLYYNRRKDPCWTQNIPR